MLVVDDSSFMRISLTHILESDKSIDIVGTATDGEDAIWKVKKLHPDVVLLDIEMPGMDGLAALAHIMAECPTPVLMLSGLNKKDAAIAIKSLDHGAVDFIAKPSGVISFDIDKLSDEIIAKVKIATSVKVHRIVFCLPGESYQRRRLQPERRKSIIVIGASTGGPQAVTRLLSDLPRDISTAIIVVQHMSPEFVPSFVEQLRSRCPLEVSIARRGEAIISGRALVAPGGCHTTIVQDSNAK
ncbi:MAG: response regulator, partial [Gammaproteobacteria bacterium]|nr:response regulator [Gammaproteobacteria bacterium]